MVNMSDINKDYFIENQLDLFMKKMIIFTPDTKKARKND